LIGQFCEEHPDLVAAIARSGHELAGHGYTHRRFTELSGLELYDELERTRSLLPDDGRRRPIVRPPHGAISLASTLRCALAGYKVVLWSRDSGDARTEHADDVVRRFEGWLEPGAIVLLHEGQGWTLDALPRILTSLRKGGHELVTVGELLGDD
jgi:peptidoglycan/xylan/chitin deacetylase (PgdA/CDA1 family)